MAADAQVVALELDVVVAAVARVVLAFGGGDWLVSVVCQELGDNQQIHGFFNGLEMKELDGEIEGWDV